MQPTYSGYAAYQINARHGAQKAGKSDMLIRSLITNYVASWKVKVLKEKNSSRTLYKNIFFEGDQGSAAGKSVPLRAGRGPGLLTDTAD